MRYARSDRVAIAYRVIEGDGPPVVFIPGFASNVAEAESLPYFEAWRPIVEATRWVMLDKRGTGLSDRAVGVADLQTRMDDVRAVMDEVGLDRAHLVGVSEGGPMSILFAATYPDRVLSLTLVGSFARFSRSPSHPWMPTPEERAVTQAQAVEFGGQAGSWRRCSTTRGPRPRSSSGWPASRWPVHPPTRCPRSSP